MPHIEILCCMEMVASFKCYIAVLESLESNTRCVSILGIHMRVMCLTPCTWKVVQMAKRGRDDSGSVPLLWNLPTATPRCPPPTGYAVNGLASEVNRSGADAQVVSCHCYPVVFHHFVEQLTVFYMSGLVL